MDGSIAAVIVTRNRLALLQRCLGKLALQTRKLNAIYVVNVASTDGTEAFLQSSCLQSYGLPVIPISLPTNVGGSGGQNAGLARAHADGHDWLWSMDDDGYPAEDALRSLLEYAHGAGDRWLNSLVLDQDDPGRLAFPFVLDGKMYRDAATVRARGLLLQEANPFNGTLIGRTVIDKIGLPCRDLFIWGDEEEYKRRARLANISVQTVTNSLFYHPASSDVPLGVVPLQSFWKYYYHVRNAGAMGTREGNTKLSYRGAYHVGMRHSKELIRDSFKNIVKLYVIQRAILAALLNDLRSYYPKP